MTPKDHRSSKISSEAIFATPSMRFSKFIIGTILCIVVTIVDLNSSISNKIRGFIAYWGEELTYDWHSHEAEEIYFILAGSGLFRTKECGKLLKANETCFHKSWQSHSMITSSEPILTFVLWRGKGMDTLSMMDKK